MDKILLKSLLSVSNFNILRETKNNHYMSLGTVSVTAIFALTLSLTSVMASDDIPEWVLEQSRKENTRPVDVTPENDADFQRALKASEDEFRKMKNQKSLKKNIQKKQRRNLKNLMMNFCLM